MEVDSIICGDCLEVMKDFPDNSVDLVLTDPPYGLGFGYDSYIDSKENLIELIRGSLPVLRRIAKLTAVTCGITPLVPRPRLGVGLYVGHNG